MSKVVDPLSLPGRKIVRNGEVVPEDGGSSDYPGYIDENGHYIYPKELDDD